MTKNMSIFNLKKYKKINEKFIYSVEGTVTSKFIETPLYSFLPYPSYDYLLPFVYTISAKGVFCVTDKRIIILERTADGSIDKNLIHSFNFNEVTVKYKKTLGARTFTIYKNKYNLFDYSESSMDFHVDSSIIKEADNINEKVKEYLCLKTNNFQMMSKE